MTDRVARTASRSHTEVLAEHVDIADKDILEVGCGKGALARWMVRRGGRVIASDPALDILRSIDAIIESERPQPLCAAAECLPLPDEQFDLLVFFNSLHHVKGMDDALREAARVLRAGGHCYVAEPEAAGSCFDLIQPVDDETEIRRAAAQSLERVEPYGLRHAQRTHYVASVVYPDFETLKRQLMDVDPARKDRLRQFETTLAKSFAERGVAHDKGTAFAQPMRIDLLEKAHQPAVNDLCR
ncbi:MAG: class I SAM-dependent methyltransferase [Geminicoccaceae bacterium]